MRRNIFDSATGNYLLIPMGTKLIGRYIHEINWNQNRIQVLWDRLVLPDSSSVDLGTGMPGADLQGYSGFKDRVNNHYGKLIPAVLSSAFLSVGARYIGDEEDEKFAKDVGRDIAYDINRTGQKIVERQSNVRPTIEVRQGYPFNVIVTEDIALEEYRHYE